jgi:hypothetical protein
MVETAGHMQVVPASLQRNNNCYEILIDFSKMELPPSDPVRLRLDFDTFFVPDEIGINGDTRELVVKAPTIVRLIPRRLVREDNTKAAVTSPLRASASYVIGAISAGQKALQFGHLVKRDRRHLLKPRIAQS